MRFDDVAAMRTRTLHRTDLFRPAAFLAAAVAALLASVALGGCNGDDDRRSDGMSDGMDRESRPLLNDGESAEEFGDEGGGVGQ